MLRSLTKYISLVIGLVVILAAIQYLSYLNQTMVEKYQPMVHAVQNIKIKANWAHLWLEEILIGEEKNNLQEKVWDNLDEADLYMNALLYGNKQREISRIQDSEIRQHLKKIQATKSEIQTLTNSRLENKKISQSGSQIDIRYDKIFESFFDDLTTVENLLHKQINSGLKSYNTAKTIIIPVIIVFAFGAIFILIYFEKRERKHLKQIRKNENNLRVTLNSIGDAVIATDKYGKITRINSVAQDLTGWKNEDAKGEELSRIFHIVNEHTNQKCQNPAETVIRDGKKTGLANHTVLIAKDGTRYQIADSASPIRDDNDNLIGVIIVFRDVTKDYEMQRKLRESNERLNLAVEGTGAGLWDWDISNETLIINEQWAAILGYTKEELEPLDITLWERFLNPEDLKKSKELIKEIFEGKTENFFLEARMQHKDGSWRWVLDRGKVVKRDKNNNPLRMAGTNIDITNRKEAEDALRESEQKYKSLFNESPVGIFRTTSSGKFLHVNPSMAYNLNCNSPQEVVETYADLKTDLYANSERRDEFLNLLEKHGGVKNFEFKAIKANGEYMWFGLSARISQRNKDGSFIIDGFAEDITERKKAEQKLKEQNEDYRRLNEEYLTQNEELSQNLTQLKNLNAQLQKEKARAQESDRLKSAFLANMSHEIRTPMNGILGFAQLLRSKNVDSEKRNKYFEIIESSGQRMLNIIEELIDISKIESGQTDIQKEETDINKQLDDLYVFFKKETDKKNIQFHLHKNLDNANSTINTDKTKLSQILTNLIKNAIKFTDSGYINFGYTYKQNVLEFYVEDTGIGIDANAQEKIFKRFNRVDDKYGRDYEGIGLGLSIAKAYIDMMDGEIWYNSVEGKGTTFFFTLPYTIVKKSQKNTEDKAIPLEPGNKKVTLLIAEDNTSNFLYLQELLAHENITLLHAQNGEEAISKVKSTPDINLVLMDLKMPKMDGFEATKQIKQIRPELPVIAQTALKMGQDKEKALNAGCDNYIAKPINNNELIKIINETLQVGNKNDR